MNKSGDDSSISSFTDNPFQRRIEFHLARKSSYPYSSSSNAVSDFHLETLNRSSDRQRPGTSNGGCGPSGSAGKKSDGGGDTLEHGLDLELRFEITFRRIGAGLVNLGNTCFLNSVLLCLTYTEPFAAYLQSGKHKSSCPRTPHPSPLQQAPSPLLILAADSGENVNCQSQEEPVAEYNMRHVESLLVGPMGASSADGHKFAALDSASVLPETGYEEETEITMDESFSFNLSTLIAATNNFSTDNKLGEGGFGPVYKGKLSNGRK